VCRIARITFRQLDYWVRCGRILPEHDGGSGYYRHFTYDDLFLIVFVARLREARIEFAIIDDALATLRETPYLKRIELHTNHPAVRITVDLTLIRADLRAALDAR